MSDAPRLFDPTAYARLGDRPPRAPRPASEPPAAEVVRADGWTVLVAGLRSAPDGVAHLVLTRPDGWGAVVAVCGRVGRRIETLTPGTVARLCGACRERE